MSYSSFGAPAFGAAQRSGVPASVSVFKPVAMTYENLLFCEEFSDIKFVCEEEVIPAHKCILAMSSPYFKAALEGPWKENERGELQSSHPARIIKAMLALLYTGTISSSLIDEEPLAFMSIASEYDIPWIKTLAEPRCIQKLCEYNLKEMWQVARLYESDSLKMACIAYVRANPLVVLANSDVITLKFQDEPSWQEFSEAIAQPYSTFGGN